MANKTNFFIICPASFKPLSVLFYFFIHPVVAVLCLCVHLCARILANIQIFNFTPKPMISSLHFHKSPKVCIIISLALVTGGYLCWGHSECRHSHEAERRGRKKKHIQTGRIGSSSPTAFSLQLHPCYSAALSAAFSGLIFSAACTSPESQIPAIPRGKAASAKALMLHAIQQWFLSNLLCFFLNKKLFQRRLISKWLSSNVCVQLLLCIMLWMCLCTWPVQQVQ